MNFCEEIKWRGLWHTASEGLEAHIAANRISAYIGFDPTASSLHVGSFLQIMLLVRLQRSGHTPIAIVGGGTGLIGDPSGRSTERQLLTKEMTDANLQGIRKQLEPFLDFSAVSNAAKIINNADWLVPIPMVDFMRDVGKHFTVNYMLAKDSVDRRIGSEDGISFTEFSYMLLQAYDYLMLAQRHNCSLQMGGSDQWGNIIAGIDLIRKVTGKHAHALVVPLITNASGAKFGKSEGGPIWLEPNRTSPYKHYQFWLNTSDADVIKYLKYFTLLARDEIAELELRLLQAPESRDAQRKLAEECTRMVHGESALAAAVQASRALFGEHVTQLPASDIADIFADVPSKTIARDRLSSGLAVLDLMVEAGVAPSKSEARRLIENGGFYLNNIRVTDVRQQVGLGNAIDGRFIVLRKGAKGYVLLSVDGA
jgi:tyrosyl-tRNA synthetase